MTPYDDTFSTGCILALFALVILTGLVGSYAIGSWFLLMFVAAMAAFVVRAALNDLREIRARRHVPD